MLKHFNLSWLPPAVSPDPVFQTWCPQAPDKQAKRKTTTAEGSHVHDWVQFSCYLPTDLVEQVFLAIIENLVPVAQFVQTAS